MDMLSVEKDMDPQNNTVLKFAGNVRFLSTGSLPKRKFVHLKELHKAGSKICSYARANKQRISHRLYPYHTQYKCEIIRMT